MLPVLSLWAIIYLLVLPLALAGPSSTVSLSSYLISAIPECAQNCLASFIATSYSSSNCYVQQDLGCLCTSNTTSGYTLGESALRCVASNCPSSQILGYASVYEVCAGIANANIMTHSTITATMDSPTTITYDSTTNTRSHSGIDPSWTLPSTIASPTVSLFNTSIVTAPAAVPTVTNIPSTSTEAPSSLLTTKSTTLSTSPSSSIATSTSSVISTNTSSAVPASQPVLTKSQIAGVAIAGVASASLAFGLLFFLFCRRRKRAQQRHSGSSFGGDGILEDHQHPPGSSIKTANPSEASLKYGSVPELRVQHVTPARDSRNRFSLWRRSVKPEEIGVAVAPGMVQKPAMDASPTSIASYSTTSQLLPDKPSYNLFPSPLHLKPPPNRGGLNIPAPFGTRQIQRGMVPPTRPPLLDASLRPLSRALQEPPRFSSRQPSMADPFFNPSDDPRALMYAKEHRRASRSQLPRIVPPEQYTLHNGQWVLSPDSIPKPPSAQYSELASPTEPPRRPSSQLSSPQGISAAGNNANRPTFHNSNPYTVDIGPQTRKPSLPLPPPTAPPQTQKPARSLTHYSTASDTSFEEDDESPPDPISALSPVVESPLARSPLNALRYPPIPGVAVRRSPESPTRRPQRKGGLEIPEIAELPGRTSPNPAREPMKGLRERRYDNQAVRSARSAGGRGSRAKIADILGLDTENVGETSARRDRMRNEMSMGRSTN